MPIHFFETTLPLPGLNLPLRSTAIQEGENVFLLSPISFHETQVKTLRALGKITDIVAPCLLHHLALAQAHRLFPEATLWGVEGFRQKRPDIAWTHTLTEASWPYKATLDLVCLEGIPQLNECVFFHRSSKTLIVGDLCFNLHRPTGWAAPIALRLLGNYDRFAISRSFWFFVKNKARFKHSVAKIFEWDFERIAMSHGEVIEKDGKSLLKKALQASGLLF